MGRQGLHAIKARLYNSGTLATKGMPKGMRRDSLDMKVTTMRMIAALELCIP